MNRSLTFVEIAGTALVTPSKIAGTDVSAELSCSEVEILMSVANGLTNQEIGMRLDLGHHTVRALRRRLYKKLSVKRRTEAVKCFLNAPPAPVFMSFSKRIGI